MTKIAIILLNWKGADDTIDCLMSIVAQKNITAYQTVVVDNFSGDRSVERITDFCQNADIALERIKYDATTQSFSAARGDDISKEHSVTLIEANENLGFCKGNNIGTEYAFMIGADAALILNNDTTIAPDTVEKLVEASESLGPRTLISPQILYHNRPDSIWWCGGEFSTLLSPSYRFQGEPERNVPGDFSETEWVSGCATLISRELFDEIGLYDPVFFIWCEEWDLSLRARSRGIALRVAPEALVYHKVGKSLGLVSPLTFFYSMRNMIILRRRYLSSLSRILFGSAYFPRKLLQAIRLSIKERRLIYLHAFLDAISDHRGGLWKRQ
ncbi:MAG: glycosyltransferase family 2 protein [Thalassococcus sp.]|uniref:glycosyltransferase family 2 protein n=1 Tax=Thalassococcus sp. TaxID=1928858 RepID=UPI001B0A7490|nr:glycosyltransferase family 2 protein [Thalassococcus sp.]MBO6868002.1 glycosyltransferase family 2 protein [Thalassococcus sp.]